MNAIAVVIFGGLAVAIAGQAWAAHRRRVLVARACHELRNPLTAARLALSAVERRGEIPSARVRALESELRRTSAALDDLTAARVGRTGVLRQEPIDVGDVVAEQLESWRVAAHVLGSDVRMAPHCGGLQVLGDRVRLAQALSNLVANALEHGAGPIDLAIRRRGADVRVEVRDHGPGLPASAMDGHRRPRWRVTSRGHGLKIAQDIARRHGGRVAAGPSSAGARVALELPLCDVR